MSIAEDVLLDFDGWLARQDAAKRAPIEQHLKIVPEAGRNAEKQKFSSMVAVGSLTGIDSGSLNEQWDRYRGGFAEKRGGEYLDAKDDEARFHALLRRDAQQQVDERTLLRGPDDVKAPDFQPKRAASLEEMSREAAIGGEDYGAALANWQAQNRGKPGYDEARAARYAQISAASHRATADDLEIARPVAEQAFEQIAAARSVGKEGLDRLKQEGNAAPFELFRGLTPNQKQLAFRVMADKAGTGDDKSDWAGLVLASQESTYRGLENLAVGGGAAAYRSRLLGTKFEAGDQVRSDNAADEVKGAFFAEMGSRAGANSATPAFYTQPTRKLTADEAKAWNADVAKVVEDVDTSEELRAFGQGVIDPTRTKGDSIGRRALLSAADSMALMGSMAIPGAGASSFQLRAYQYQNEEYRSLRAKYPDMEAVEANKIATVTGIGQAGLDVLEFGVLGKGAGYVGRAVDKVPFVRNIPFAKLTGMEATHAALSRLAGSSVGARLALNITETTAAETIIEQFQDHIVPAMVQDLLKSDPKFDVSQTDAWIEAIKTAPETALGMVLLSAFGAAMQTARPVSPASEILRTGDVKGALAALEVEHATLAAKQASETAASAEAANYAVRVVNRNGAWEVTTEGGETITVDSAEAARRIRNDLALTATQREADTLVAEAEAIPSSPETGVGVAFTGKKVRVAEGGATEQGVLDPVEKYAPLKGKGLDTLHEEAARVAETTGDGDINAIVNGSNTVTFREDVAEGAKRITQEIEVNRTEDPAIFTLLHEKLEAVSRTLAEKAARGEAGGMTLAEQAVTIVPLAPHFDPSTAKNKTEKLLFEQVQKVAKGEASAVEAQETLSELAVGEVIRRRKDGTPVRSRMTEAMSAALDAATDPAQIKAIGRLRATINALRTYFRAVLGTVAALRRANKEGKSADFESLIDKLTGVDEQARHDMGAMKDAESMLKKEGVDIQGISASKTYRLSAGNRLEAMQRRADTVLAKDPAKRREVARRVSQELQKLQFNAETRRFTAKGDEILPIIDKRTTAELDKETAFRQADERAKNIAAGMGKKEAASKAREVADEWRKSQEEMMAKQWNPKAALLRDLRAWQAILSVLPKEVRDSAGLVKLATLSTDAARLKEVNRLIEKVGPKLEKHFKDESTAALDALIEKAAPQRDGGKQSRGKIGAEAHAYFDAVSAAKDLTKEQVEGKRAEIQAEYATPGITDAQAAALFEREQILDTFGAFKEKNAADADAALQEAEAVYAAGRNRWRTIEEARLAHVGEVAAALVEAQGPGNVYLGSQTQKGKKGALRRMVGKTALDLKSFGEVLAVALGESHPLAKEWTAKVREGFAQADKGARDFRDRFRAALESATGEKGYKARRVMWDMGHEQTLTVRNEGQHQGASNSVPVAIIDAWRDGSASPDALGINQKQAEKLISERKAMEADDRRETLPLDTSTRSDGAEIPMTEAEGMFLTMLGAQEEYAAALDHAGWTADSLASVESQLSDAAKELREFMRAEYKDGYGPLAAVFESMFGVRLPQIKNYAPAAFYHQGAEKEAGPEDRGGFGPGMRAGFLANRKKHAAMPKLENAFATLFGHVKQMEHWKALAEFSREFQGVLAKPAVKTAIEARHGVEMVKTLNDWARNIEGNGLQKQAGVMDSVLNFLISAQSYIALAYNLGTILKQSSALLGSAYKIPFPAYVRGLGKLMAGQLDARAMWNTEAIRNRLESGFAPEARIAMDKYWTAKPTRRGAILDAGMQVIGFTDAIFTTGSAAIAYDHYFSEAKREGFSDEAAHASAMREVESIVAATAQPATVADRSLFEARQGAFGRLLFLYASEARQKSSLLLTAWGHTLTGRATSADLRVLAIAHLIVAPLMHAISAAMWDWRDPSDDEWFDSKHWNAKDFLISTVAGPLGGIPLIGDALSGFQNDGVAGRFKRAFKSSGQIIKTMSEGDDKDAAWYVHRVSQVMQGMDAFTGVVGKEAATLFDMFNNAAGDED